MSNKPLLTTELIGAFQKAGIIPERVLNLNIRTSDDEWVIVAIEFAITSDQLKDVAKFATPVEERIDEILKKDRKNAANS